MNSQDMIDNFLKNNEVTECIDDDKFTNEKMYLISKSHRTAYDYKLEPLWDMLEVKDNDSGDIFWFTVKSSRTKVKAGAKKRNIGATIMYLRNDGRILRENTITDRISSGQYTITKKPKE